MFVLSAEFDFRLKDGVPYAQAHGIVQTGEVGIAAVSSDQDWVQSLPVNSWPPYCAFAGMGNGSLGLHH